MKPDEAAAIQALASVAALVVAGLALVIAWMARGAEQRQADAADRALRVSQRQLALSMVSYLGVDHPKPEWVPDYPYLKVTYRNGGTAVAYAIRVSAAGANKRGVAEPDSLAWSGVLPALLPGDMHTTHVPISEIKQKWVNEFRFPHLVVKVEYRSAVGGHVSVTYDMKTAPEPEDEVWSLWRVTIDPLDGGDPVDFTVAGAPGGD